jgi:hypothetical protein
MSEIKAVLMPNEKEEKIVKQGIGFGNRYGTLNPLVLIARKIASKWGNDKNPEYDYFITRWISFGSSSSHIMGLPIYSKKLKEKLPWLYWLYFKVLTPIHDWKLRQHYRFFVRHHKLTILNIEPSTYTDPDERVFHAVFSILGNMIEDELGPFKLNHPNYHIDSHYRGYNMRHGGDETFIDMWLWYKFDLPREIAAYENWQDRRNEKFAMIEKTDEKGSKYVTFTSPIPQPDDDKYSYNYIEDLKQKKLVELIEMRQGMWT